MNISLIDEETGFTINYGLTNPTRPWCDYG
jgi:hypothetical protein